MNTIDLYSLAMAPAVIFAVALFFSTRETTDPVSLLWLVMMTVVFTTVVLGTLVSIAWL